MELIQFDRQLFLELNTLGDSAFDQFWILISATWIWVPLYMIFLYLLKRFFSWRQLIYILIFIALGVTVSDQLAGIYKVGIARLRPCHEPYLIHQMRSVKCGGQFGFYSSHASNTFFLASFLTQLLRRQLPKLPFILFIWAVVVSYSRIYLGVHFPLDIVMGAAVGFLLGGFFATLSKKVIYRTAA